MLTFGVTQTAQWLTIIIYLAAFLLLFYLMVILPRKKQEKQHNELVSSLAVKDRIVTIGGIVGEVRKIKENSVLIRTGENTELEVLKSAVSHRIEG